jgi:prolyl oligopeptidase
VRLWRRGTDIHDAPVVHEGAVTDVSVSAHSYHTAQRSFVIIGQGHTFYSQTLYGYEQGRLIRLDLPADAFISAFMNGQAIIGLRSDWKTGRKTFRRGSVVSAEYAALLTGKHELRLVVRPDEKSSVDSVRATESKLLVSMLSNVKSVLYVCSYRNSRWIKARAETPEHGTIDLSSTDPFSDEFFYYYEDFLTPSSLYCADAGSKDRRLVKSMPSYYDGGTYQVWQYLARSKDGTDVPYFVVGPKSIQYDGSNPTVLYAYGGFEIAQIPHYLDVWGRNWLEKGGVYVLANIRGGGEFGPRWHQAGLKEKRQNVFDDFYAVSQDLMGRKISSPRHLGIKGGSNGGLLMGVALTQRPELYGAVVCSVPLLDMRRFNKLLAGASWMGEYGNPDLPEEWAYIKEYSPYHNLKNDIHYPGVLFTTSTRDDRVHPGHARKMAAKMSGMGHQVLYYENTEGGHAGSSTNAQVAKRAALEFSFLSMKLR